MNIERCLHICIN